MKFTVLLLAIYVLGTSYAQVSFYELQSKSIDNKAVYFLNDSLFTGVSHEYYRDSTLRESRTFKNGIRHGLTKEWSPAGVLLNEILYENDQTTGTYKRWNMNGRLVEESKMKNETGFYFCDCRDAIDSDACEYGGEQVWAYYEKGIKSGKWKIKTKDEIKTITHYSFGYSDFIRRFVIKNEEGEILKDNREATDKIYEKENAIHPNRILYGNKRDLFYDRQSASFVNPIHQDSFPDAGYFNGFQKPISCSIIDFHPNNQIKLKAIIKDGKLSEIKYYSEKGELIDGYQTGIQSKKD